MKKKIVAITLAVIMALSVALAFSACGEPKQEKETTPYGNTVVTRQVTKPSDDVDITVVRKKTASTTGKTVIARGEGEIKVNSLSAGDLIQIDSDYCWIKVKLFDQLGEAIVYSPTGSFTFEVPASASVTSADEVAPSSSTLYPAGTFSAADITAEVATADDIRNARNLAVNPYDFMYAREINDQTATSLPTESESVTRGEVVAYPHAYANRVTRNETEFFARNAIDGRLENSGHGAYPYQSWGYNKMSDAEFTVYFGREVSIDDISFVLRADYSGTPAHDTAWESVTVEFSNGATKEVSLARTADKQSAHIGGVKTEYVRLSDIKTPSQDDTQGFAALTELEVYGADTAKKNVAATKTYVTPAIASAKRARTTKNYSADDIEDIVEFVNDWFMEKADGILQIPDYGYPNEKIETLKVNSDDWRDSVYYSGLLDYFLTTGDEESFCYLRSVCEQFDWLCNSDYRTPHADHYLIGEMYLQMNDLLGDNYKIQSAVDNAEWNVARDPEDSKTVTTPNSYATDSSRDWSHMAFWWCDALYMGMNTYTLLSKQTGEDKYIKAAYDGYMHWKGVLYNEDYHLWHRDSTQIGLEANATDPETGKKYPLFWSRGNGWVLAALAKQLMYLDENEYPDIYEQYRNDFIEIASVLPQYQREDGTWNASIVDETCHGGKETTGTCGFLYGIATGIALGVLDYDTYFPVVEKAWDGMMDNCMLEDANGEKTGQLGYMQTVGYQPQNYRDEEFSKEITDEFGMGLFLLAASSLIRLCNDYTPPEIVVAGDRQSTVRIAGDPFQS